MSKKTDNRSTGGRFEQEFAELLDRHGFWCHVLQQNKSGQPADIIAVKGRFHCLIDCKVVSTKKGFVLDRAEENQRLAMRKFRERCGFSGWFAVKFPNGEIRMMSIHVIQAAEAMGYRALSWERCEAMMTVTDWINAVNDAIGEGDEDD